MPQHRFIIEVFDLQLWCPVLETMFATDDTEALRKLLGKDADNDPELEHSYRLDEEQLAAIVARFRPGFETAQLAYKELGFSLFRWRSRREAPYLIHGGYELPLLLERRKKLARFSHEYPPMTFEGENRFDHWVAEGTLHREVVNEPFDPPIETSRGRFLGHRTIYYTLKGEEWRIPAMKLIWQAAGKSGGWNEYFERLEGMLFGYEEWQNDWWIKEGLEGGGFGGMSCCCAVSKAELEWMESAGFRALPPIERPTLGVVSYRREAEAELVGAMLEDPGNAAVVRFNVAGIDVMKMWDLRRGGGPYELKAAQLPGFNRLLRGPVVVIARRDEPNGTAARAG
jgi:hypothetical protein